jgi:pyrroloquinoline quinone biosynthesis protein B
LVLGAAQDGGLPQAGCYSPRCDRARRIPRYVASLAIIQPTANRYYLVDATPDLIRQLDLIAEPGFEERAQSRRPFDAIFLTHAHIGHYLGLAVLGREGLGMAPTRCYCTPAMADYLTRNGPWSLLVSEGRLTFPRLDFDRWTSVDEDLSVRILPVPHRREFSDTVAFFFRGPTRTLLYLPDIDRWETWDRRIEDVVREVDVALLDATFYSTDELPGRSVEQVPHPLVPHTMDRLEPAVRQGKRVVFTHLNNTNPALDDDGPEAREVRRRGFEIAREGMRFDL